MVMAMPGERYAYKRVKSDAAAARREFAIPFEWFAEHCHKPCHYCGRIDINKISVKSRSAKAGYIVKDFRYNGIDRVNNSIGYTPENCVPCCVVCIRGKNSMGLSEWIAYLDTLVEFRTRRYDDGYEGRHVRSVPLSISGRDGEAGNEVKVEFASGGYVSSPRNHKRPYYNRFAVERAGL
jgi:hypothetical protein